MNKTQDVYTVYEDNIVEKLKLMILSYQNFNVYKKKNILMLMDVLLLWVGNLEDRI